MGVLAWARKAADNAVQVVGGFQVTDLLPSRNFPAVARDLMAQMRCYADDTGGALRTAGTGNSYVVATASGITAPRPGLSFLLEIDRANTDAIALDIDGTGPRPWLDMSGVPFPAGALQPRTILRVTWSETRGAWVSDALGGLTAAALGLAMRAWWLSLPDEPRGLGPNMPYRNNGTVAWTGADNPAFAIDSPAGRRLTLQLLREALPTSPDGLAAGEPWANGDMISFVPDGWAPPVIPPDDTLAGVTLRLRTMRGVLPKSPDGLKPGDPWLNGDVISFVPEA